MVLLKKGNRKTHTGSLVTGVTLTDYDYDTTVVARGGRIECPPLASV